MKPSRTQHINAWVQGVALVATISVNLIGTWHLLKGVLLWLQIGACIMSVWTPDLPRHYKSVWSFLRLVAFWPEYALYLYRSRRK